MRPILPKNNLPLALGMFVFLMPSWALSNDTIASKSQKTDNQSVEASKISTAQTGASSTTSAKQEVKPKVEDPATSDKAQNTVETPKKPSNSDGSTNFGYQHNPNRYAFHFLAWINDPYIAYQVIPDPYTGRFHTVPVVRYNRILVRVYLDRITNTYGYFDRFGNPVPYLPNRYQYRCFPF